LTRLASAAELAKLRQELAAKASKKKTVSVTNGTDGRARGSLKVMQALHEELEKQGLTERVAVKSTGCHGFCEEEPTVLIMPEGICYVKVQAEDVPAIVEETLVRGKVVERLLYKSNGDHPVAKEGEIPFYQHQSRVVLGNNRLLDMESIDDYIALDGYSALAKALLEMTPDSVLAEVRKSNLRGRGGGGFPAGLKWETTKNAAEKTKYVIVNADEGDPGAYMDRSLLEGNPHSVIEGLIIGAYAIGAHQGFIYVRQEYPLAVDNLEVALAQARDYGLLGKNILGSGFDFDVIIHRGAGAFVSGESSALMTAIEGQVGQPRPKYIRTAVSGLWGKPTNLNNVETWATVPLIINKGADWFASIGTKGSKGTKIFSLVGKVNNTGLVEIPMGMTLRQIIYDIGGGIPKGKKFKAVQTGGPSGGVIPESLIDTPVDYDELTKAGSMMGSGGMIVMDEDNCMVDIARYFLNFLTDESCGQCIPCRLGIHEMLNILNRITSGQARPGDIKLLEDTAMLTQHASLCALGTTAANPVLSTLRYFRDEYEAHVKEKRCPAGACKALINYYIDPEKCQACMLCLRQCPAGAISGEKNMVHVIDQTKCTKCGACFEICPARFGAVVKLSGVPVPPPVAPGTEVKRKRGAKNE
jgi:NADP-reducing hydrogenase subunit HndC